MICLLSTRYLVRFSVYHCLLLLFLGMVLVLFVGLSNCWLERGFREKLLRVYSSLLYSVSSSSCISSVCNHSSKSNSSTLSSGVGQFSSLSGLDRSKVGKDKWLASL